MTCKRQLAWDGCNNVRDLGGLRTADGRMTCWGALVRSDDPARLTASGWASLHAHGIRTIISLQTDGLNEDSLEAIPHPPEIAIVRAAIEDIHDAEFVQKWVDNGLWSTPLYYQDALQRWPEKHAAAVAAIAQARPGGVLIHCHRGNDRTGIMSMLLLALAGVEPDEIARDYELSPDPERDEVLACRHTSNREVILKTLAGLEIESYLLAGGLSKSNIETMRTRLLEAVEAA